ncbi:MAG: GntR family transcriptional regulator [Marinobacter sp.]|uniref:GntR family transcriptional regulator n=1 Tax=Marinobacter sp. TaxID=50741 RepID=UPI0032997DDC
MNEAPNFRVMRSAAPLRHSVTENIRNAIAVGHFKPGERLPERELCEMIGVSRTLVREALRQLESEGLIFIIPHRGPVVATLTVAQAKGIYAVRTELEGLASELFAEQASDAQLLALKKSFEELKIALTKSGPIDRLKAKNYFYDCLVEGSGNEALGDTLRMLNSRVTLLRATSLKAAGRTKKSIEELERLMKALSSRDALAARKAAAIHVKNAAAAALSQLSSS